MRPVIVSVITACAFALPARAQELPVNPAFAQAVEAIDEDRFEAAADLVAEADTLTRDLALWLQYRAGEGDFADMAAFVASRPTWPGLDRIRGHAERALAEEGQTDEAPVADILAFFVGADIETGEGAVEYANALIASGRTEEAKTMLAAVWTTQGLSTGGHQAIINAYPDVVAPFHDARADMLLWRWRTSDVQNLLPLLDEGHRALVNARIAIITRASDVQAREDLVPDRLRDDAGLHYDRFNWFADRGDWTQAIGILLDRSTSAKDLGVPWRWGSWRRILARWQMREGNTDRAYDLAANHFIAPDETNYSDLEWLAGYLALTYLGDPALALEHFQNFDASVTTPISKGRAGYWLGRTYEDLGDADAAVAAYLAGAEHQTSFYGLLSAEHLGLTMNPDLIGGEDYGDWRASTLLQNDLVRAGLSLLEARERGAAVLFFAEAAKSLSRREIGQLGQLLMDIDEPFYTVLVAKTAVRGDVLVQDAYFPIHPLADLDLPVEPALALAIARQESEFRVDAGSSVGALGLMQLMPATAQDVAGWLDLPYSRGRLTSDWEYNAQLGSEYLAYLQREFGNSPVMIAAGYNAGPSRPRSWMTDRGDPRRAFTNPDPVDGIDWIEHIPFRETRNYVMRVTEGIPIYRARLSGVVGPVRFTDLLVGAAPVIRPVARPDRAQGDIEAIIRPPVRRAGEIGPAAPAGPQPVRPVARTGDN